MPRVTKVKATTSKPKPKTAKKGVLGRIQKMEVDNIGYKIALYGRSKTGKTTFWGSFPGKILAIICSGGLERAGELLSINTPEHRKKVDVVYLEHSEELKDIIPHVRESGEYSTVVLDHASSFQDMVLAEILDIDELPEQSSWGLATQQEYGQCTLQCKQYFRHLLDLPGNVIIVAQERMFDNDSDNDLIEPYIGCALSPSLAGWLHAAPDYIMQMFIRNQVETSTMKVGTKKKQVQKKTGKVEYCLRIGPSEIYVTNVRKPKGGDTADIIVDPTYEKFIEVMEG